MKKEFKENFIKMNMKYGASVPFSEIASKIYEYVNIRKINGDIDFLNCIIIKDSDNGKIYIIGKLNNKDVYSYLPFNAFYEDSGRSYEKYSVSLVK